MRVYRRYLQLEPGHAEEYIAYLKTIRHWGEAAQRLADCVNDENFRCVVRYACLVLPVPLDGPWTLAPAAAAPCRSLEGKTKYQLWLELCDLITKHPEDVKGLRVEAILRHGIRKFTDEVGRLWISLADYYIRRGEAETPGLTTANNRGCAAGCRPSPLGVCPSVRPAFILHTNNLAPFFAQASLSGPGTSTRRASGLSSPSGTFP